jgi:hypothetical protein
MIGAYKIVYKIELDLAVRPYGSSIFMCYPISDFTGIFVTLFSCALDTSDFEYQKVVMAGHTSPNKEFSFL